MENKPEIKVSVTPEYQRFCKACGCGIFVPTKSLFLVDNPLIGQPPIVMHQEGPYACFNCNYVVLDYEKDLKKSEPKKPELRIVS